jgi:Mg-chelatase subunit ChlI
MVRWLLPSTWRAEFASSRQAVSAQDGSSDFDEDDGEELYEVNDVDRNRREALSLDAQRGREDSERRLSRDLEEGFKDDSEDEEDDTSEVGNQGALR